MIRIAAWIAMFTLPAFTAQNGPIVRMGDAHVRQVGAAGLALPATSAPVQASVCNALGVAHYGQPVPGGGTLACIAHGNAVTRTDLAGSAFFSAINGSPRNQAIFIADAQG